MKKILTLLVLVLITNSAHSQRIAELFGANEIVLLHVDYAGASVSCDSNVMLTLPEKPIAISALILRLTNDYATIAKNGIFQKISWHHPDANNFLALMNFAGSQYEYICPNMQVVGDQICAGEKREFSDDFMKKLSRFVGNRPVYTWSSKNYEVLDARRHFHQHFHSIKKFVEDHTKENLEKVALGEVAEYLADTKNTKNFSKRLRRNELDIRIDQLSDRVNDVGPWVEAGIDAKEAAGKSYKILRDFMEAIQIAANWNG